MTDEQPSPPQAPPPPPPPMRDPNASTGSIFAFNRPTMVVLFYLATYFTVFSCLIGVVLAYVWRNEPHEEWEESHYTYLIRTFWMVLLIPLTLAIVTLVAVSAGTRVGDEDAFWLALGMAGMLVFAITVVLLAVRCILALVQAQKGQPMPNPRSWLV